MATPLSSLSLTDLTALLEEQVSRPRSRRLDGWSAWVGDVTLVAQQLTGMPVAFVSLLDATTTTFLGARGVDLPPQPRGATLCDVVARTRAPYVVTDAAADPELREHPTVQQGLKSYVGVPIPDQDGTVSFALCVADGVPHEDAERLVEPLSALARVALRAMVCD